MYLCRTNQTNDDDGLSQMQKCRPCEERDGWRKTEIQVQGLRLQLHGGEQVGRAVPRGAQDGLESVFGGTRIQGYREGVGDKLWHGVPMDKEVGEQVELSVGDGCVPVVELDELHSYVQSKNYRWIWIAVDRLARQYISFVCGDRSGSTGVRDEIGSLSVGRFFSDH